MAIHITYTKAQENLAKFYDEVVANQEVVIIKRQGFEPVALIAASELTSLLETVHLLRSSKNAKRLFTALKRAEVGTVQTESVENLRQEFSID